MGTANLPASFANLPVRIANLPVRIASKLPTEAASRETQPDQQFEPAMSPSNATQSGFTPVLPSEMKHGTIHVTECCARTAWHCNARL